jgi:hypothetical protein
VGKTGLALAADLPEVVPMEFAREFQASTVHLRLPDAFFDGIVAESAAVPGRIWRATFDGILAYDDTTELAASPRRRCCADFS